MVDYANLHGLVKALSEDAVCPICGQNEWDGFDALVRLPFIDEATEGTKIDEGVVALA